jgi:hypothetical protein
MPTSHSSYGERAGGRSVGARDEASSIERVLRARKMARPLSLLKLWNFSIPPLAFLHNSLASRLNDHSSIE